MLEEWKPVVGWDGLYEVSNIGNVRSVERRGVLIDRSYGGRLLSPVLHKCTGRLLVNLSWDGTRSQRLVHTLVLDAFVGSRPPKFHGCHDDGNPLNNALSNLRWDTPKGNHADKKKHGTWQGGENNANVKLSDAAVRSIKSRRLSGRGYATIYGVTRAAIYRIWHGKGWSHIQ